MVKVDVNSSRNTVKVVMGLTTDRFLNLIFLSFYPYVLAFFLDAVLHVYFLSCSQKNNKVSFRIARVGFLGDIHFLHSKVILFK